MKSRASDFAGFAGGAAVVSASSIAERIGPDGKTRQDEEAEMRRLMTGAGAVLLAISTALPAHASQSWAPQLIAPGRYTLLSIDRLPLPKGQRAYVNFVGDRVEASAGCNGIGGTVRIRGTRVTFGQLIATQMGCPEPLMTLERKLMAALSGVAIMQVASDGRTTLRSMNGSILTMERIK